MKNVSQRAAITLAALSVLATTACRDAKPTEQPGNDGSASQTTQATTSASAAASASAAPSASLSASALASAEPVPSGPPRPIDMHVDTPWQVKFKGHSIKLNDGQMRIEDIKNGLYGGVVYPIYISDKLHDNHPTIRDAYEIYDTVEQIVAAHSDLLWLDSKGPTPEGMVTIYVSIEGAGAFAENIKEIDHFIERGVVFVGPVHWSDDKLSTSATGSDKQHGLSKLGKQFCERVYTQGGLVDVSHMSDKGFEDLVPIADKFGAPIVATHSNSRAVMQHNRNLTDDQLKTIARTNGVAGLNFYRDYVKGKGTGTVQDLVQHALHMIDVAGIDHVGLGSDYDGGTPVEGLETGGKMQALADALREAGLSEADIHKIFSENVKRVIQWAKDHRPAKPAPTK
ncbi:MAG: membrane dipeptidase [Polyangiaceae bacterium]